MRKDFNEELAVQRLDIFPKTSEKMVYIFHHYKVLYLNSKTNFLMGKIKCFSIRRDRNEE